MAASDRFTHLDAMRAVAVLAVFYQHILGALKGSATAGTALQDFAIASSGVFDAGRFGVVLFFMISGFVVPFSIKGDRPLTRFGVSRFFRLYPAFWLALIVVAISDLLLGKTHTAASFIANATMAPSVFQQPWMNGIFWTLFIELLFYFASAALFFFGQLRNSRTVFALGAALLTSTLLPAALNSAWGLSLPTIYIGHHLSILFSGLLIRLWIMEGDRRSGVLSLVLISAQLATVLPLSLFSAARGDDFALFGWAAVAAAYALAVIVFVAAVGFKAPKSRLLAFVGRISYSIYLLHWPVIAMVMLAIPLTGDLADIATLSLMLAITLLASWTAYRFVEKPCIALGQRLLSVSRVEADVI